MVGEAEDMIALACRMRHTLAFLRMASIELRRIAQGAPDIAVELRHMARQLEDEANELAREDTESAGGSRRIH